MKLTNQDIVSITSKINNIDFTNKLFPIKVIFYIQKNQNILMTLTQEIEQVRLSIFKQYGDSNEDQTEYKIRDDVLNLARKKLQELANIEQEVDIKTLSLSELKDMTLTKEEMDALFFMIRED